MPKETILHTNRINHDNTNQNMVVVSWGKGHQVVSIGVQEPGAIPGERETGHFADLHDQQIDQIIAALKRAKRQAYSA